VLRVRRKGGKLQTLVLPAPPGETVGLGADPADRVAAVAAAGRVQIESQLAG
jgi:hypothetical protein